MICKKISNMEWKDIKGYEGIYKCSDNGDVLNVKRNNILKPFICRDHFTVNLCVNNKKKCFYLHRLVYETFVGEIPKGWVVCHKDCNNFNNKLSNLKLYESIKNRYSDTEAKKIVNKTNNKGVKAAYAEPIEGEIWVDVIGANGIYKVSNLGRVKRTKTNRLSRTYVKRKTYNWVRLNSIKENIHIHASLHRIVYESFYGKIKEGNEVDHINSNSLDDRLENLREVTKIENRNNPNSLIKMEINRQKALKKIGGKTGISIIKVDLNGNVLEKYKSTKECSEKNKISLTKIKKLIKEKQNIENEFYLIKEHDYNNYFDEESEVKIAEL